MAEELINAEVMSRALAASEVRAHRRQHPLPLLTGPDRAPGPQEGSGPDESILQKYNYPVKDLWAEGQDWATYVEARVPHHTCCPALS